tara:strand:+ start:722 stop:1042 length:321 start_codon:yes stop_codon:yes gene_type:complete
MALTTTWSVPDMIHNASDGGVFEVIWNCKTSNNEGPETARMGSKFLTTYNASSPNYVPYADLTQAIVLQWIWDSDDVDKDAIEASTIADVNAAISANAATASGTPW